MSATRPGWPFHRDGGVVLVQLQEHEREVLGRLIEDLRDLLMAEEHATLRRLKPPARPDDAEAEAEYRSLIDDDLLRSRLELLDLMEADLAAASIDDDSVSAWMQGLNMMRLILGEGLALEGVDLEADELPEGPMALLFQWMGELLGFLVEAALPSLPDETSD